MKTLRIPHRSEKHGSKDAADSEEISTRRRDALFFKVAPYRRCHAAHFYSWRDEPF